jgi:class 3 adenylate cyclase/predicted ATPase
MEVAGWLRSLGLERYIEAFQDNAIDADILPKLTVEDLRALGVAAVGDRRKLLDALAVLRAGSATVAAQAMPALPSAEGERRQVTVVFADLAGYTALSNKLDAEELHALLGRFFEQVDDIVLDHGGSIDKHIGDCVMGLFGAPVAHSNDAERAALAALAIRDSMPALSAAMARSIQVHIGVAAGEVVASGTGSASHREYTVTGESVNLAARLADDAAPGEILISDAVRRALADRLECDDDRTLAVKGLADPVRVWRLRRLRTTRPDRPFVGRHVELQQFQAALATCREAGRGQTVLLRGEAGIGKTRLAEEFQRMARTVGFACHTGLVLDFGAGTGRDTIRALVRSLLGLDAASDTDAVRIAATRALAEGLVAADRAVFLNDLLNLPQPVELRELYDAMDHSARSGNKRAMVAELVRRLGASRPLMLTLEDLHWADAMTLAHATELAATVAECPAVLVMTSRIDGDPLDHAWRSQIRGAPLLSLDLGPLRHDEALALAAQFVDANDPFALACVDRAAGNPLFLEQLLRSAEEPAKKAVPGTIRSLVLARMDTLPAADKGALQAASALGQRFARDALRHVIGDPSYDCARLIRHHLVQPAGEDFLFAHALIQEGVYSSLLKRHRRDFHRRAAEWFSERDAVLHAEHLDRAEDDNAPRAYLEAARQQLSRYELEEAQRLVECGLKLVIEPAIELELACLHGDILREAGSIADSISAYKRALGVAQDDKEKCRAHIGLASDARLLERYDEALELLDEAEVAATRSNLIEGRAQIHYHRASICFRLVDSDSCLEQASLALQHAQQCQSAEHEARALSVLGDAYYMCGRMITAHNHYRRCVEISRQHGLRRIEIANLHMQGLTQYFQGDLRAALKEAVTAADAAAKIGQYRAEMLARGIVGGILLDTGDMESAEQEFRKALDLARTYGARSYEPFSLVGLGKISAFRGHRTEALRQIDDAITISRGAGLNTSGPRAFGALALITEDPETRDRALAEGQALLRKGSISHHYLSFYRDAIETCVASGDWSGVERYAAALEEYTQPEPLPLSDFFIARGRALAAFGRGSRAASLLAELKRLKDEGERLCLRPAVKAIEAALAGRAAG